MKDGFIAVTATEKMASKTKSAGYNIMMKARYKILTLVTSVSFAIYLVLPQIGIALWQLYAPR